MMNIKESSFLLLEIDCSDTKYSFARCCFRFGHFIIGDYDQWMVAGALALSLKTVLRRVGQQELINCNQ